MPSKVRPNRVDTVPQRSGVVSGWMRVMTAGTESSETSDDEVRRLYERYQAARSDEERHEIALEMGELDGRRHAEIYEALEVE